MLKIGIAKRTPSRTAKTITTIREEKNKKRYYIQPEDKGRRG